MTEPSVTEPSVPGPPGGGHPRTAAATGTPGPRRALRRGVATLLVDVQPLRTRAFAELWTGTLVSFIGTQVTAVVVPLQVYARTRSSLLVGLVSLAALVPLLGFGLVGGAIADAVDRRRLALVTTGGLALTSVALAVQSAAGGRGVGWLFVLVAVQAGCAAVDSPARQALTPRLLPDRELPAAAALGQVVFGLGAVVGPLLAGLVVALAGFTAGYLLDAVSFAATAVALLRLAPQPPTGGGTPASWRSIGAGLRFVGGSPVLAMTFYVDLVAMIFGMPRALFPALARELGGGPGLAGALYAAVAAGALAGAVLSGPVSRVRRQGLGVLLAVAAWAVAITVFGVVRNVPAALLALAVAGAADLVSAVLRNAVLLAVTPDALRGRLSGLFTVVVTGGPRLGDVESGVVAGATGSLTTAVVSGGVACLVGVVVLGAAVPAFRRYRRPEPAVATG